MALTRRFVWPRLRSLTLASALVALLAIPALAPAAGAQVAVDIGINDDGVKVHTSGTVRGLDAGVVIYGGAPIIPASGSSGEPYEFVFFYTPPRAD